MTDLDYRLEDVKWAARELERAKSRYEHVLRMARRAGFSNQAIAQACGKTEAAVRMYLKRKEPKA